ncbi:DUF115 domain-containing protein [Thiohalobacter sp. IOR34]|uniref:6-hydroxymethylpterin diphosphokinase MptE-like protein n=1 Tax=Thiohalobacter sp. IOR34 TaxID=3057176 RepID=UPI0025AF077A|nr:6-hydroxymethylpterin diphosphokinase MptE-like protein [Thiohalobacter sp. IOR34]WJW74586.1 DUF115 domain-containing protein [Thiohalobacter sp. IOR34]
MSRAHTETGILADPFARNPFGECYLHAVNRSTFASVGAQAVFQRHFGDSLRSPDTLYIIVGTDSGLLIDHLQREGLPEGSRYLFVELPEVLPRIQDRLPDDEDLDPRITLVMPGDWQTAAKRFSIDSYVYLDRVRLCKSVGAADAFLPAYRLVHRALEADLNTWIWSLRSELETSTFSDCQLANLSEALTPAIVLKDSLPGRTAVLLGGGPSLDELLPWIRERRDHLVLIAVSRIARRLLQEGIEPDIVCTIDPTTLSFDVSREMLKFGPEVLLVSAYHAHPPLVGQWRGRHVYLGPRLPWQSDLNETNIVVAGPTVTNTALGLAVEMGVSQVILAGVDLCFSRTGDSHAGGSNERSAGPLLGHMGPRVETNAGELAETTEAFQQGVDSIGRQAALAAKRGCRFINPAANAARVPHVEYLPLEQIEIAPVEAPASRLLQQRVPAFDRASYRTYWRRIDAELAATEDNLRAIGTLAREALRCNERLFGPGGPARNYRHKLRMDKIEKRLDAEYSDLARLVKQYGIRQFLRTVRTDDGREWTDTEIEETGRIYYEAYIEGADRLLASLGRTRCKIDSRRLEEAEPEPTALERLADIWLENDEPGRAVIWKHRHPEAVSALSAQAARRLAELESCFEERLHSSDTRHMARCKAEADLAGVPSKAIWLFQHRDADALQRLVAGLERHPADEARPMYWLASGYLAELEARTDEALAAYQQIQEGPLLEEALRRITALSLEQGDYASALLALDCLGQIAAAYLPQQAELLKISGDACQAAEVYARYLEQVPEDHSAMLKLGQLYQEQGILEGARWAFEQVLAQDAGNRAARGLLDALTGTTGAQA